MSIYSNKEYPYSKNVGQYDYRKFFQFGNGWEKEIHQKSKLGYFPDELVDRMNSFHEDGSFISYDKSYLNTLDEKNCSPLFYAVKEPNFRKAYFMLKSGADPNIGNSILEKAMEISWIDNFNLVYLLLLFGADTNTSRILYSNDSEKVNNIYRSDNSGKIIDRILDHNNLSLLYAFIRCGYVIPPCSMRFIDKQYAEGHRENIRDAANERLEIAMVFNYFCNSTLSCLEESLKLFLYGYDAFFSVMDEEKYEKKFDQMYEFMKIVFSNYNGRLNYDEFFVSKFIKKIWGGSFVTVLGRFRYNKILLKFIPLFDKHDLFKSTRESVSIGQEWRSCSTILHQAILQEIPIEALITSKKIQEMVNTKDPYGMRPIDYLSDIKFIQQLNKSQNDGSSYVRRYSPGEREYRKSDLERRIKAVNYAKLLISIGAEFSNSEYEEKFKSLANNIE